MYNVPSEASRLDPRGAESVIPVGPLAQLGERRVRNAEVVGSNPMRSTIRLGRGLAHGRPHIGGGRSVPSDFAPDQNPSQTSAVRCGPGHAARSHRWEKWTPDRGQCPK